MTNQFNALKPWLSEEMFVQGDWFVFGCIVINLNHAAYSRLTGMVAT